MEKDKVAIVIGTAHLWETAGKRSVDGKFLEAVFSREVGNGVKAKLEDYGYQVFFDYEPLEADKRMYSNDQKILQSRELSRRVEVVNSVCRRYGAKNVLFVSIHVDASGMGDRWMDARGWSVRVCPKASVKSRLLAECLYDSAQVNGIAVRPHNLGGGKMEKYWEQSLKVLNDTRCPAVLTENLFMDNKQDLAILMSDDGRHKIERLHVEGIINYIERL